MIVQRIKFSDIFALWPSSDKVAWDVEMSADLGVSRGRVRGWMRRHFIPPWYWDEVIDAAKRKFGRDITYRQLVLASIERGDVVAGQARRAAKTRQRNRAAADEGRAA